MEEVPAAICLRIISDLKTGGDPYFSVLRMEDWIFWAFVQMAMRGAFSMLGPRDIPAQPMPSFRGACLVCVSAVVCAFYGRLGWMVLVPTICMIESVLPVSGSARLTLKPLVVFVQDWKAI